MLAQILLDRLGGVRETGPNRWLAQCSAHEDKTPSLSVREVNGRVLVHCFAGCSVHDVIGAAGLELHALFETGPDSGRSRPAIRPVPARDILLALGNELAFVVICASDMAKGESLKPADNERLWLAHSRFRAALHAGGIR